MEDSEFFYYARYFMKAQGYSLDINGNTWAKRTWATSIFIIQELIVLLVAISVYFKYPDLQSMITTVAVTIGLLINSFKIGTVHAKIEEFAIFLKQMAGYWKYPLEHEKDFLLKHKTFTNRISVINFVSLLLGIYWWLLMPLALNIYETSTKGHTTWVPAWNVTYIEIFRVTPGYESLSILNFISTTLCVYTGCGFDAYFLESCFYLSGHFKIIRERFRSIKFSSENLHTCAVQKRIGSLVEYHTKILEACDVLEGIAITGIFPFLICDSILLCTIFYTVLMISDITYTVAFTGLLCAALAQIGLLTYSGNYLYDRSQEVMFGIYDSNWFDGCCDQSKLLIPPLCRSRGGKIFKMGFFNLTLLTFSSMLQSAGSYVALIKSLDIRP